MCRLDLLGSPGESGKRERARNARIMGVDDVYIVL